MNDEKNAPVSYAASGSTWETAAPGCISARITSTARNSRKMGLMILPIQTVILPGLSEKNRTNAKKTAEKIRSASGSREASVSIGVTPVVKDVVAQRGMAKSGPMVRYRRHVKNTP